MEGNGTYNLSLQEFQEELMRKPVGCTKTLVNKMQFFRGTNIDLTSFGGNKKDNCIFFSCTCDSIEQFMAKNYGVLPKNSQMPWILCDEDTMKEMHDHALEMVANKVSRSIIKINLIENGKTFENELLKSVHCLNCGYIEPRFRCPNCYLGAFCDENCYNVARFSGKHTILRCNEIRNTPILKEWSENKYPFTKRKGVEQNEASVTRECITLSPSMVDHHYNLEQQVINTTQKSCDASSDQNSQTNSMNFSIGTNGSSSLNLKTKKKALREKSRKLQAATVHILNNSTPPIPTTFWSDSSTDKLGTPNKNKQQIPVFDMEIGEMDIT